MNARVRLLALSSLAMLVALIIASTYWQAWAAPDLASKSDNAIQQIAEFTIDRGRILAANGTVLAKNRVVHAANRTYYYRRYPQGALTAAAVGYATQNRGSTGLERSASGYLTGADQSLAGAISQIGDRLLGSTIHGSDIVLSLNLKAQRVAMQALDGNCGAAVAIEPSSGRVLVLASKPSYNPSDVENHIQRVNRIRSACTPASPLVDRATQGLYPPGSSFKVVTAAAALDSGRFTPDSIFHDPGYCTEYGKQVKNFADLGRVEVFGTVTLFQALQNSINSVFCNVGMTLGIHTLMDYARRFGFGSKPPLDLPGNAISASGLYLHGSLLGQSQDGLGDPGRVAFGQDKLLATPLQMAMVAATVANGGVLMRPHLVDRVIRPGGKTQRIGAQEIRRVIKPQTAAELTQMMEAVVTSGTGTAAQIPGVRVAGKTGTAENGPNRPNTTWFIAFAPAEAPRVAVAVVLENQRGVGGTTAAPIAREIMQAILATAPNSNS
ncbi:MAG: penicillin-binding protein 2 [Gaiellaceae bacterium]|jgi:peptidoglycan glycosyltransferase